MFKTSVIKGSAFLGLLSLCFLLSHCNKDTPDPGTEEQEGTLEIPDWTTATHSNDVEPNFSVVFPNDEVLRLDITISASDWSAMQNDLATNLTTSIGAEVDFTPIWVPCSFKFDGLEWYKVGIRYKGNSTLRNAYEGDNDKYPFKIDFDQFEDLYPIIIDQRFYGFKQLNLSNNYDDGSQMREKIAGTLFENFGIAAPHTSFCAIYLDRGTGAQFIGMYTIVEEVDDTLYKNQFPDKDGNLYKPDGDAASFAAGSYNASQMDLKTNTKTADYSDVKALYDLMQSPTRTTNEAAWKQNLESIFNVDNYLKYLAANTVIQNWDTYGKMTHNYFLYNDLGRLTWIPWDNNESLKDGKKGGALSLSLSEVNEDWPLIRYIMDVPAYDTTYKNYVRTFSNQVFDVNSMNALISGYESLISNYATQESTNFSTEISMLKAYIQQRKDAVDSFLN